MTKGTLIAVLVLSGYVAFEAYAIRQASDRTEPAYIHNLLIEAQTATETCKSDALELRPRFTRTLARVTSSYKAELEKSNPELSSTGIEQQINEAVAQAQGRVTESLTANGCTDAEARAHFQRYRIYASKTR